MSLILGIESSCDETACAIVKDGFEVLSSAVASQIAIHAKLGGVVPELAAREHLKALDPVVSQALDQAGVSASDIDCVAVTQGPGLIPALLVGLSYAKGLASNLNVPLVGVNHFMAHIYGAFLDGTAEELTDPAGYPLLALVVSGGHTSLVLVSEDGTARQLGCTIDDAAGEALDKGSKLLDLGYPGGPIISKVAENGDPEAYNFPRPLTGGAGKPLAPEHRYNFSFSGIKTALLYHTQRLGGVENIKDSLLYDTVASYQMAVVDTLTRKTMLAAKDFNDDRKDAGEIGSGHTMTAFYEIIPAGTGEMDAGTDPLKYQKCETAKSGELLTVKMRYKKLDGDKSILIEKAHAATEMTRKEPSADFRFASAVAEFALLLEDSKYRGDASFPKLIERARSAKGEDREGYRAEFIRLAEAAEVYNTQEEKSR